MARQEIAAGTLPGDQFGNWTIIQLSRINPKTHHYYFLCRCQCGTEKVVALMNLRAGKSLSCGCRRTAILRVRNSTHGCSGHPAFYAWKALRSRCNDPKHPHYQHYGGRGITVCPEWNTTDPRPFMEWALANGWAEGLEIDRRENDAGYSPGNCRWVTRKENMDNRRITVTLTAFGETKSLREWAKDPRCKIGRGTLESRVRREWDPEQALTTPSARR